MKTSAQHIKHIMRPQEFSMPGSVAAVHPVPCVRTEMNLEPGFATPAVLSQDGRNPIKQPQSFFFFCEIYCFHIKRFFLRGSIFFNHMMTLYSCPE